MPIINSKIPNMDGFILTVSGPITPDNLGNTLMHEHLFLDLRKTHFPHEKQIRVPGKSEVFLTSDEFPATELSIWLKRLSSDNIDLALKGEPIADNYVLEDEEMAIREVQQYHQANGHSIVDVTSIGLKRDPEALLRVSKATNLNIIMAPSHYQKVYHPEDMDQRKVQDLTKAYVRDITEGVYDTKIRSGIIGEVGINGAPITENEIKVIRASAQASILTGAAITFHRGGDVTERHKVLDILEDEGVNLSRVILGHQDELTKNLSLLRELLERNVFIQFDLISRDREPAFPNNPYRSDQTLTEDIAEAIVQLTEEGYEDRILLSHDVCQKVHLTEFGGAGYAYILNHFLPRLQGMGISKKQTDKFVCINPTTILPFIKPER